jgi:hypothetical protein
MRSAHALSFFERPLCVERLADANPGSAMRAKRHHTSFAPETLQTKRNERDQIQTKRQQNQQT